MNDFDPIEDARLPLGQLMDLAQADKIAALTLQAGLRTLLSPEQRAGLAIPTVFPNDPPALQAAQGLARTVMAENRDATPVERVQAMRETVAASEHFRDRSYAGAVAHWAQEDANSHMHDQATARHFDVTPEQQSAINAAGQAANAQINGGLSKDVTVRHFNVAPEQRAGIEAAGQDARRAAVQGDVGISSRPPLHILDELRQAVEAVGNRLNSAIDNSQEKGAGSGATVIDLSNPATVPAAVPNEMRNAVRVPDAMAMRGDHTLQTILDTPYMHDRAEPVVVLGAREGSHGRGYMIEPGSSAVSIFQYDRQNDGHISITPNSVTSSYVGRDGGAVPTSPNTGATVLQQRLLDVTSQVTVPAATAASTVPATPLIRAGRSGPQL